MTLTDKLTTAKNELESYLNSVRGSRLEKNHIDRLFILKELLGLGGGNSPSITKATSAPTLPPVVASITSVTLLADNTNRKFASFRNNSTSIAYIEFGATATTSSVYKLAADGFMTVDNYTGTISCIWTSANGNMLISQGI
jgi:hypothetical protein